MPEPVRHLKTRDVWARFGISKMTLHRWLQNEELGFPKPIKIQHRSYFRLEDIEKFEQRQREARS